MSTEKTILELLVLQIPMMSIRMKIILIIKIEERMALLKKVVASVIRIKIKEENREGIIRVLTQYLCILGIKTQHQKQRSKD